MVPAVLRLSAVVLAIAALVFAGASPAPASTAGAVVGLVNSARSQAGMGELEPHSALASVAQSWAEHMANTSTLAHNPNVEPSLPPGWTRWGENVAYNTHPDAHVLHTALMNSSPHRANILGNFSHIGVGYATNDAGHGYLAQVFATLPAPTPRPTTAPSPAPTATPRPSPSDEPRPSPSPSPSSSPAPSPSPSASPTASTPEPSTTTLPEGWVGPGAGQSEVKALQRQLIELGYDGSIADGHYGPVTRAEVVRFQRDHGLVDDGLVGPLTQAVIDDEIQALQEPEDDPAADEEDQEPGAGTPSDDGDDHGQVMPVIVAHTNTPGAAPLSDGAPVSAAPPLPPSTAWQAPAAGAGALTAFGVLLVVLTWRRNRLAQAAADRRDASQVSQALLDAAGPRLGARA